MPPASSTWLGRHLSASPATGITQLALIYVGALCFSYVLEFAQTYLMQWTGQKIMYDMRSQIFRHLQRMHVAFFDRNPVGRLVTRLTSDVDALNEMFTSGVFAIFEDVFVLLGHRLRHAAHELVARADRLLRSARHRLHHTHLPHQRARLLPPHPHRHRAHQRLHPGARHRHERGAALRPRAARLH